MRLWSASVITGIPRWLAADADGLLGPQEQLDFERRRFGVRLALLAWPVVLILLFGAPALNASLIAAAGAGGSAIVVGYLLRSWPSVALRLQLPIRLIDVALIWYGLSTTQEFLGRALGDQLYLLPVISATAGAGKRGSMLTATAAALAIVGARARMVISGVLVVDVATVIDTLGQILLLFAVGFMLHALMRTSALVTERRQAGLRRALAKRNAELEALRQSERHEARAALRHSEARYRLISELVTDFAFVFRMQSDGSVLCEWMTDAVSRLTGFDQADLTEVNRWAGLVDPEDMEVVRDWWRILCAGEPSTAEFRIITRRAEVRYLRSHARPVLDGFGRVERIFGAAHDITEQKHWETALEHQALHDALTALPNRALLHKRLEDAVRAAQRSRDHFSLALVDLDRFKLVNDTYGHQYGDMLLQQVADRLRNALRPTDTVARLGGDEFALLLPGTDGVEAHEIMSGVHRALVGPFDVGGHRLDVGASLGLAMFPAHGEETEALLRHADLAMYASKRIGGGCTVYEPTLRSQQQAA
jgi:diguanylate cyclase (GGDEF)-like protein/PAS domain S-box-containing protein